MKHGGWTSLLLIAALLAVGSSGARTAHALDVVEAQWGFDGQVVPYRFNLLSVLVSNPAPEPFDGVLELQESRAGTRVGALQAERVYLAPYTQRWVQFYPYVFVGQDELELSWGTGPGRRYEVQSPRIGEPARIVLERADAVPRSRGGLKRFREDLFPPMVTATDALAAVVLDHSPRWERVRREAFLDWLHRGGTLHVFQQAGRFPQFSEELAALNGPLPRQRIGAGTVYRHERDLSDTDAESLRRLVLPPDARPDQSNGPAAGANDIDEWDLDDGFFSGLRGLTRPEHNWKLIHLLSLVYLALVFPGCWLLGRRRADYRVTFTAILALVGLFSWAFAVVGRRGYGETTTVNSVAVARPLPDGAFDVTGWTNVFVTDGDWYAIAHTGNGRLYSTGQSFEAVRGVIDNGLDGVFRVDIPPFSSRPFAFRMKTRHAPLTLAVEEWSADATLQKLTLRTEPGFPEKSSLVLHALYRNQVYRLVSDQARERFELIGSGQSLAEFLPLDRLESYGYGISMGFDPWDEDRRHDPEQQFDLMRMPLMARSLGLSGRKQCEEFSLPGDRVRVFVYAPMPETWRIETPALGNHAGYVLYSIDVFRPEAP